MSIKELFDKADEENFVDLQALIMFLVLEKQVLSMEDDAAELDRYFLEKHNERMNHELRNYKMQMKIEYGLNVYELKGKRTYYIVAKSENHAAFIANQHEIEFEVIEIYTETEDMVLNGVNIKIKDLKTKSGVIGGHDN